MLKRMVFYPDIKLRPANKSQGKISRKNKIFSQAKKGMEKSRSENGSNYENGQAAFCNEFRSSMTRA